MSDTTRAMEHEETPTAAGAGQEMDTDLQLKRAEMDLKKADLEIKRIELELRKADISLKKAEMFEREVTSLHKAHDLIDMLDLDEENDGTKLLKRKIMEFVERFSNFTKSMTAADE